MMTVSELKMPSLKLPGSTTLDDLLPTSKVSSTSPQSKSGVTVYKWQDDQGIWHFSNKDNRDGDSITMVIDANRNVTSMPRAVKPVAATGVPMSRAEALLAEPLPILHAGEVLQEARNVENILQQRYQRQERALNQ